MYVCPKNLHKKHFFSFISRYSHFYPLTQYDCRFESPTIMHSTNCLFIYGSTLSFFIANFLRKSKKERVERKEREKKKKNQIMKTEYWNEHSGHRETKCITKRNIKKRQNMKRTFGAIFMMWINRIMKSAATATRITKW